MRRIINLVIVFSVLLILIPVHAYCSTGDAPLELEWDYVTSYLDDRDLDTVSLHILKKTPKKVKHWSVYRGITITRATGSITLDEQKYDSPAFGAGPVYMIRNEKHYSDKFSAAFDISGGFIVYDKTFPAGGRWYNFMWRLGPKLIYRMNDNSSLHIGYTLMHVSNGLEKHNPGYDAHGVSFGVVTKF